jgi:NADH-quinone oxidoreductase subunit C
MSGVSGDLPTPSRGLSRDALPAEAIESRLQARFPELATDLRRGELTVFVAPDQLVEVVTYLRDDDELSCELLSDLSGVHWPAGEHVIERQTSTTGWPEYRVSREDGVIEVDYIVRSVSRNHWLRLTVATPDDAPQLPSVVAVHPTANFHEREVYDMFGVEFVGHPDLQRILMPDDWLGHPHRKDYPLGGIDIPYKHDKFIPPPDERDLREVVE